MPFLLAFIAFFDIVHLGLTVEDVASDVASFVARESIPETSLLAVQHKIYKLPSALQSKAQPPTLGAEHSGPEALVAQASSIRREHSHGAATASAGPNRTAVPPATKAAMDHEGTLIRQIFVLCVTMYGTIAILWALYWQRTKATVAGVNQGMENFYVTLLCISWASMSVGMHVLNKSLVEYLQAPALISGAQMLMAVVVMGSTSGDKLFLVPPGQLKRWLVVPIFFAGMLCSSFYAYERISLSLLTVVRNLTPLVALPLETIIMPADKRPTVTLPIIGAIFVMLVGAIIYGDGILPSLSMIGLMFALLNMALAVTDRLVQRRLLTQECKDLPSDVCTIVNNFLGLIPTIALAAATHQLTEAAQPEHRANWTDPRVMVLLLISGLVGIGICYLGFQCQRAISATSFFVLQNVSKVAVVSAGVVFFADPIKSASSVFGLALSLGGSFMYGAANMMQTPAKSATDTRRAPGSAPEDTTPKSKPLAAAEKGRGPGANRN